jgi:hypothetical protein
MLEKSRECNIPSRQLDLWRMGSGSALVQLRLFPVSLIRDAQGVVVQGVVGILGPTETENSLIAEGGPLTASRDRALILIGFAGELRRSELAGIRFEQLQPHAQGITITLPKSKTDQKGQGREVEIARGSQPEHTPLDGAFLILQCHGCSP